MTLPIKTRISTELIIDTKQGLYIQKWLAKSFGKIECIGGKLKFGNEKRKWQPA